MMKKNFAIHLTLLLVASLFFAGNVFADTNIVYSDKHVTDTVYVTPPPDTFFVYDSSNVAKVISEEAAFKFDKDTIAPATNVYIGLQTFSSLFSLWVGTVLVDFDYEFENTYDGSVIVNFSTMMEFLDFEVSDDKTWEGYRSVWNLGFGYRYYLGSIITNRENPKNKPILHRNVPLNTFTPYIQAMLTPAIKFAYDGKYDADDMSASCDIGGSVSGAVGFVWNISNVLWNLGLSAGYQYWDDARDFLTFDRDEESGSVYHVFGGGTVPEGMFFRLNLKMGI